MFTLPSLDEQKNPLLDAVSNAASYVLPPLMLRRSFQDFKTQAEQAPVGSPIQKTGEAIATFGETYPHVARPIEGALQPYKGVAELATGIQAPQRLVAPKAAPNDNLAKLEELVGRIVGSYPLIAASGAVATGLGVAKGATLASKIAHEAATGALFGAATQEGGVPERITAAGETARAFAPFGLASGGRIPAALKVALGSLMVDIAKDRTITPEMIQNSLASGVLVALTGSTGKSVASAETAKAVAIKSARETLGVRETATIDEIKSVYKDLAKQFHPDVGGTTEKMAEINKAYETLSGYQPPAVSFIGDKIKVAWSKLKSTLFPEDKALTLFHGTNEAEKIKSEGFKIMSPKHGLPILGEGVYLTPAKSEATNFGKDVLEVKVDPDIKLYQSDPGDLWKITQEANNKYPDLPVSKAITKLMQEKGYGGMEVVSVGNKGETYISIFDPRNITVPQATKGVGGIPEAQPPQLVETKPAQLTTRATVQPQPIQVRLPSLEFDKEGAQVAIHNLEDDLVNALATGKDTEIGNISKAIDAIVKEGKQAGTDLRRSSMDLLREKANYMTSQEEQQAFVGFNKYDKYGTYAKDVKNLVDAYRGYIKKGGEEAMSTKELQAQEHIPQRGTLSGSDEIATSLGMDERDLMAQVKKLAQTLDKMTPAERANPFLREELKQTFEKKQEEPKPVAKGVETGVPEKSVEDILASGPSFDRYARGRYYFALEKYTHKDTSNAEWFAENIPLTRMGNKRGMIGYILNGLGVKDKNVGKAVSVPNALEIENVTDIFGGSGFLSVLGSKLFPQASRVLNEYDSNVVSYYQEIQRDPKRVADWVAAIQDYVKKNPGKVDWKKELKLLRPDFQEDPSYLASEFIVSYNDDISRGRGVREEEFTRIIKAIYNFSNQLRDIKVVNSDAMAQLDHFIKNGKPTDFLFIDPPYIWSSGYGVGSEFEKASGFLKILGKLDQLSEKGIKFMFFNNEPASRVSKVEPKEQIQLASLEKKLDEMSKNMTIIRNISPLGAQNREELMIINYLSPEGNTALRPIKSLQDVLQYEVSVKGELPKDTKVFIAEASDAVKKKWVEKGKILAEREFDALMKEADKVLFGPTKTIAGLLTSGAKGMKDATNQAIRDRLAATAGDVTIFDYGKTPEGVFKKIGMESEFKVLRKAQDTFEKEIADTFKTFNEWFRQVKGKKDSALRIFDYLDGQEILLSGEELNIATNISNFLINLADRQGLPAEKRITNYITHIFEPDLQKQTIPPEIMAALEFAAPRGVFNPFLEKRLGASGYVHDVWRALEAYTVRSLRKIHLDTPIDHFGAYVDYLPASAQRYVKTFLDYFVGRPDKLEGMIDDTIRAYAKNIGNDQIRRYFSARPTRKLFGTINMTIYRGALGLNVGAALRNVTQVVNTMSEEGPTATLIGYASLFNPQRWKETDAADLMSDIVSAEFRMKPLRDTLQKLDRGLFVLFDAAERINRFSNYFAARYNGAKKGLTGDKLDEFARDQVRKTQFGYGKIDMPLLLQDPVIKSMLQFSTFPIKQAELIGQMAKNKEFSKLLRYILSTLIMTATVGTVLGFDWKDALFRNVFPNLGPLPQMMSATYKLIASKSDKDRADAIKEWSYLKDLLIPGGVQISKTIKGINAATSGKISPQSKQRFMRPQNELDAARAAVFGTKGMTPIKGGNSTNKKLPGISLPGVGLPKGGLP